MRPLQIFRIGHPAALLAAIAVPRMVVFAREVTCFDHPDPLNRYEIQRTPCSQRTKISLEAQKQFAFLDSAGPAAGGVQVALSCPSVSASQCDQARQGFALAKQLIESVVMLLQPVLISATFTSFCTAYNKCGGLVIGQAGPKRSLAILDTDNTVRLYPQSLVKQLQLSGSVSFEAYDIEAMFNSDVSWWFATNASTAANSPTTSNREDFVGTILHEIMHGLGFMSAWNDYFGQLVPGKKTTSLQPYMNFASHSNGKYVFEGFMGLALDRLVVESATGKGVSERVAAMNQFTMPATAASSWSEFFGVLISAFEGSPQFALGSQMLNINTGTLRSLMVPNMGTAANLLTLGDNKTVTDGGSFWFETSITPFASGSSISHAAIYFYAYSPDFLMCYRDSGIKTYLRRVADNNSPTNNPIGPRLLTILELLGYATYRTPTPVYRPIGYAPSDSASADESGSVAAGPRCCLWQALALAASAVAFSQ